MKTEDLKRFRTALVRAANKHIKSGGKIIQYGFRTTNNKNFCPIGAYVGAKKMDGTGDWLEPVYKKFNMTGAELWLFVRAFDHDVLSFGLKDPVTELGRELRTKYIKETKK